MRVQPSRSQQHIRKLGVLEITPCSKPIIKSPKDFKSSGVQNHNHNCFPLTVTLSLFALVLIHSNFLVNPGEFSAPLEPATEQ